MQILKPSSTATSWAIVSFSPAGAFNWATAPVEGEYLWNPTILDLSGGFYLSGEMRQPNLYLDPNAPATVTLI